MSPYRSPGSPWESCRHACIQSYPPHTHRVVIFYATPHCHIVVHSTLSVNLLEIKNWKDTFMPVVTIGPFIQCFACFAVKWILIFNLDNVRSAKKAHLLGCIWTNTVDIFKAARYSARPTKRFLIVSPNELIFCFISEECTTIWQWGVA